MKWTCIDVRHKNDSSTGNESHNYAELLPKTKRKLIFGDVFKNGKLLDSKFDAADGVSSICSICSILSVLFILFSFIYSYSRITKWYHIGKIMKFVTAFTSPVHKHIRIGRQSILSGITHTYLYKQTYICSTCK